MSRPNITPKAVVALKKDFTVGVLEELKQSTDKLQRYDRQFEEFEQVKLSDAITRKCHGKIDSNGVKLIEAERPLKAIRELGLNCKETILLLGESVRGDGVLNTKPNRIFIRRTLNKKLLEEVRNFKLMMGLYQSHRGALIDAATKIVALVKNPSEELKCWR